MEEQKNIQKMLQYIPQPGFCAREGIILSVNQAAQAILLSENMPLQPLFLSGWEEYTQLQDGQLYVTLTLADQPHNATVTRISGLDLFLLDSREEADEFRFMALVSMELRNPLMRLMSNTEQLLRSQDLSDPESAAYAAKMNRSLHQMMRIICNMSDVSRYTASSRKEVRDVDGFLEDLFHKAQTLASASGFELTFEGLRQPVFSLIDAEQLERAVWNILSNSAKFMTRGDSIHATLTRQRNLLKLQIQDSGSGIAQSVRSDLFQRYLRQPGIEDSRFGLGLGMIMIRTAAANHGGTLLIDQPEESGTRVTMTLPICQDDSSLLRSPILRPDYTGGWDHGLLELSDTLPDSCFTDC